MATKKDKSRKYIENIILNGSKTDKIALYNFTSEMSVEEIAKRFNLFVVGNFTRYYSDKPADFHEEMIKNYIRAYLGEIKYLNIGFRGSAKTTLLKLFMAYTLLNDSDVFRKYIKVITKDTINSKQIVTDVYNLIVEVSWLYGDLFEKEGKTKKEESMTTFALKTGVKLGSGTVGQVQRGQVQDAYRPDFLWFEDVEDSATIRSMVQTQNIISKIDEAIQGMSDEGSYVITANYISEEGTVEWFKRKKGITTQITPILKDGEPTWDKYTPEKIKSLLDDAEDPEGDYMCVKPDTLIKTARGERAISELKEGDIVITHKNRARKVLKVFKTESDELLDLTINGRILTITKNHPVLTEKNIWKKAGELKEGELVFNYYRD